MPSDAEPKVAPDCGGNTVFQGSKSLQPPQQVNLVVRRMSSELIISVWLVDPIGGEFVNWPDDLDDGLAGFPENWSNPLFANVGCQRLPKLAMDNLWVPHCELADFEAECQSAIEAAGCKSPLARAMQNLLKATRFARSHPEAGVYVG